ncbi:PorP/SprF family type IX secretion system membrane protein [Pedobacter sp. KR3-3]|uniref:PorP/SprF family type IX secretion system membrane protein n=1 Tax=Pedobacter albus TaxID=3113905 RepID=A0ABU7I2Z2_9SPHI|nr:PorP/SprF family type IX secretion system membrane protein [Pedobacter sp. KR3-3]MEE1943825.1 PorP/SprF family type IX secretion system membrane protein [Pedobacter sp. KR3-3]
MKINFKKYQFLSNAIGLLLLSSAVSILGTTTAQAQLNPLTSQYFLNQYQANPAFAGMMDGLNVNLNYRKQWSNIPGSPSTQSITADYKMNKVGLGLNVFNEKAGSLQRTKAVATYAYHLPLNDNNQKLNFGASVGIMNERIDYSEVNGDPTDMSIAQFNNKGSLFDGDFGIAYTSNKLNIEAALPNIRSLIKQEDNNNVDRSQFYAAASYKFGTGTGVNALEIEPKVAFRGIKGYENIVDAGANFIFAEKIFIMGMYHTTKSASFGAGINYKNSLAIMGFYTTETSALQGSANGTFEISLRASLFK